MFGKISGLIVSLTLMLVLSLPSHGAQDRKMLQLKALFLYNFANFVEWPKSAFKNNQSPINMCLLGDVPFSGFLKAVNGTLIGNRSLQVSKSESPDLLPDHCHMLFVGNDLKSDINSYIKRGRYLYVLSIGEQDGFIENGGMVNIFRASDRVQFDIDLNRVSAQGLHINSDLLSLARKINGQ